MLEGRSQLGPDTISQLSRQISKNLSFLWVEARGFNGNPASKPLWVGSRGFNWEADPQGAILESAPYINWAFPRIVEGSLSFFIPPAENALWTKNAWGIWEPDIHQSEQVSIDKCVGVLVPGVAFDRFGHRLGYGKGFYDRALSSYNGLKAGVGFSMQVIEEALPQEAFDVAMNFIVTDKEIIRVQNEASFAQKEN